MGNVKDGKYKVIENYNSVEGALYVNEVVKVYDNNTKPGHLRAKDSRTDDESMFNEDEIEQNDLDDDYAF